MKFRTTILVLAPLLTAGCFAAPEGPPSEALGEQQSAVTGITSDLDLDYGHVCAIKKVGTSAPQVYCWGAGSLGQLGDGTTTTIADAPVATSPLRLSAVQVSTGFFHTCATYVDAYGFYSLRCWGSGQYGALGTGDTANALTPTPVSVFSRSTTKPLVSAGQYHTCALNNGIIKCWGDNSSGQLGNGVIGGTSYTATTVVGISNATQLDATGETNCALLATGEVRCWGGGSNGELGNGQPWPPYSDSATPVTVWGIDNAVGISMGWQHACALLNGGYVKCWGRNIQSFGSYSSYPSQLSAISSATNVSAGANHSCVVRRDGTVACWGDNSHGQLGNGTTGSYTYPPVTVIGINNAVQVVAGSENTCARLSDNSVKCWGEEWSGELGNGPPLQASTTPVTALLP